MFERKHEPLISHQAFVGRVLGSLGVVFLLTLLSLLFGIWGFCHFESYSVIDGFLNAAMLLGGMVQIGTISTDAGKIFAGCYAIYSGIFILVSVGIVLTPILHRLLHNFHLDLDEK